MAEARKNTLLYHFNAMNVVKKIQNILKLQPSNGYGETFFTAEEIHKVYNTYFLDINMLGYDSHFIKVAILSS